MPGGQPTCLWELPLLSAFAMLCPLRIPFQNSYSVCVGPCEMVCVSAWERISVGNLTRRRSLKQTRNLWCIPISSVSGDVFVFVADANNSKLVLGFLLPTVSAEALFFFLMSLLIIFT